MIMENLLSELKEIQHNCALFDGEGWDCNDCPYVKDDWGICRWTDILGDTPKNWNLMKLRRLADELVRM